MSAQFLLLKIQNRERGEGFPSFIFKARRRLLFTLTADRSGFHTIASAEKEADLGACRGDTGKGDPLG